MEIERKFLLKTIPDDLYTRPCHHIEQGYLCTDPVVRIRKADDNYYLTYKGKGKMAREEHNLPLNEASYIQVDVFIAPNNGLHLAEVEFDSMEQALSFVPPEWFGEDVTQDGRYHNSHMSGLSTE